MTGSFLVSGLLLGVGPCGLHCTVLLAPVAARTAAGWKQGVGTALLFGGGKVLVMSLYGALAAAAGDAVYRLIGHDMVTFAAGMVLAALGVWFLLRSGRCGRVESGTPPFLLGIIDGLIPCGTTTGFQLYVGALGRGPWYGLLAGGLFGLGTVISPLLVVCGVTPALWSKLARFRHSRMILRILGAAVLFLWSIVLLIGGGIP